jgi:integrase
MIANQEIKQSFKVRNDKVGARGSVYWRLGSWWVRFTDRRTKKMHRHTLRTTDAKLAKQKAMAYITMQEQEGIETLRKHEGLRNDFPTIGQIIENYLAKSKCDSAEKNTSCLLRVVGRATGLAPRRPHRSDPKRAAPITNSEKEKVMAVRSTELNAALVRKYKEACGTADYSIGSALAGAKAIFAKTDEWLDFKLPDLTEFKRASKDAKQKYDPNSFQHIAKDVLAAMEQDSRMDQTIRRAFICCRYLGMTPKEVSYARKGWIESRAAGQTMCIRERRDQQFTLKTGGARERDITLAPWMAEELMTADDYLVPLRTEFLRYNFMLRVFNTWLRKYIPDRVGAAYELRKQAGSDWLEATGQISQVQKLLGHSSPVTTSRWYATWQKAVSVPAVFQERPL